MVPEQKGFFKIWSGWYRNRREFFKFDRSATGTKGNFLNLVKMVPEQKGISEIWL